MRSFRSYSAAVPHVTSSKVMSIVSLPFRTRFLNESPETKNVAVGNSKRTPKFVALQFLVAMTF